MNKELVKNEIKSYIAKTGNTLTSVVNKINENRSEENKISTQNLSNKLYRGTIKYSEILEIAEAIDYKIVWLPKE